MMRKLTGIFRQIEDHSYTVDNCFLCGKKLNPKNRTAEHVIPQWLQRRLNLWDQKLRLLNGTDLRYSSLTIPCCFQCNNRYLEPFENVILRSFESGFDSFAALDREVLFYWLGKIYFGMIYKELFLSIDKSNPKRGTITTPEFLSSYYSHLLFLQGIRGKHKFRDFFPASILMFKVQKPNKVEEQWDYWDDHSHRALFISLRMGEIGLIASLQDGGAVQQFEKNLEKYRSIVLHPLQFSELCAQVYYKSVLMNRTPKYIMSQFRGSVETHQLPMQGLSSKSIFDPWKNNEYASILSLFTGVPVESILPGENRIWTCLDDSDGNPASLKLDNGAR